MTTAFDFEATTIDGAAAPLAVHRGKVLLIVNTASRCGFTPQYAGLEELYRRYVDRGLVVLGFPCDQFGHQEPGDAEEIRNFCSLTYDVTFPMFAKVDVNGSSASPLYRWLRASKRGLLGSRVQWNFTKFLLDSSGAVVHRYGPKTTPEMLAAPIEALLPH